MHVISLCTVYIIPFHTQTILSIPFVFNSGVQLPRTSAPAEKNRPSPVRTVKTVSGSSLKPRIAAMVSSINLPPKLFSCLGRLNWEGLLDWCCIGRYMVERGTNLDNSYLTCLLDYDILIYGRHIGCRCVIQVEVGTSGNGKDNQNNKPDKI